MKSVLLVEGHRRLRDSLREMLANFGIETIEASDPIEAVVKTNSLAPGIIVLETNWHEVNGICLSRMLRALAPASRIVLLVDDGWMQDDDFREWSGADACVSKKGLLDTLPGLLQGWSRASLYPI